MEWLVGILTTIIGWIANRLPWRRLKRWAKARDLAPAEDTHFTVLVCDLAGDDDGSQTRHVADALAGQGAIRVRQFGRCLDYDDLGDIADNIAAAETKGRDWLAAQNADILIWGRVKKADEVLSLRILSGSHAESQTGQSYRLSQETVELPRRTSAKIWRRC